MNDTDFFRPLWLRLAIVMACIGWAALEWLNGQSGWALCAGAAAAYGIWSLFITYPSDSRKK